MPWLCKRIAQLEPYLVAWHAQLGHPKQALARTKCSFMQRWLNFDPRRRTERVQCRRCEDCFAGATTNVKEVFTRPRRHPGEKLRKRVWLHLSILYAVYVDAACSLLALF
eukprot:CAMPEP_0183338884 /NCGR_PEP_ID=MMETSP0164_2-20130417/6020_1 /TAXON_ID=221442 /ORGANISM="Coccolithus pelagicus ssp braarudi, Strain PLY182g" /LENGTH=109 /DNA_ID=CAMNT_0025508803 /DNA_START=469 /DNA_END=798 /DNA_ORIENTATION=+